jgi:phosphoglucomutase
MDTSSIIKSWREYPSLDKQLKTQLDTMSESEQIDAFYKNIEFGTAGMRGLMGPGPNRINLFTIRKATVGFGQYLLATFEAAMTMGVVIAHDNRYQSREFNDEIAATLSDMGFKVYIFDELRPTPELSFAVRVLKA